MKKNVKTAAKKTLKTSSSAKVSSKPAKQVKTRAAGKLAKKVAAKTEAKKAMLPVKPAAAAKPHKKTATVEKKKKIVAVPSAKKKAAPKAVAKPKTSVKKPSVPKAKKQTVTTAPKPAAEKKKPAAGKMLKSKKTPSPLPASRRKTAVKASSTVKADLHAKPSKPDKTAAVAKVLSSGKRLDKTAVQKKTRPEAVKTKKTTSARKLPKAVSLPARETKARKPVITKPAAEEIKSPVKTVVSIAAEVPAAKPKPSAARERTRGKRFRSGGHDIHTTLHEIHKKPLSGKLPSAAKKQTASGVKPEKPVSITKPAPVKAVSINGKAETAGRAALEETIISGPRLPMPIEDLEELLSVAEIEALEGLTMRRQLKIFLPGGDISEAEGQTQYPGPASLVHDYGENLLSLVVVDPYLLFLDWEITEDSLPSGEVGLLVRIYDITGISFSGSNAHSFVDIMLDARSGRGYCELAMQGREILAEIGFIDLQGNFRPLVRSARVSVPHELRRDDFDIVRKLQEAGIPVGY